MRLKNANTQIGNLSCFPNNCVHYNSTRKIYTLKTSVKAKALVGALELLKEGMYIHVNTEQMNLKTQTGSSLPGFVCNTRCRTI